MLLLNMPNTIVHRIDSWSPLLPPASHARVGKLEAGSQGQISVAGSSVSLKYHRVYTTVRVLSIDTSIQEGGAVERNTAAKPGLLLREVDEEVGSKCGRAVLRPLTLFVHRLTPLLLHYQTVRLARCRVGQSCRRRQI